MVKRFFQVIFGLCILSLGLMSGAKLWFIYEDATVPTTYTVAECYYDNDYKCDYRKPNGRYMTETYGRQVWKDVKVLEGKQVNMTTPVKGTDIVLGGAMAIFFTVLGCYCIYVAFKREGKS
ncbi:hypothetical protein PQC06_gp186 [Aeromonas phage LAh10]|uniref:Uncharacterized protein n=1 Tax=Aeromonas phage LAh10 TaxID=2591025 RepID=A0A514A1S9_9CAUD|nr:hypothetical protein PQC06_gp186 [Aeromonas phage LAh10]QDH47219.1 hypothetical protein LAh10_185 [Aeromonas phage LAh10]